METRLTHSDRKKVYVHRFFVTYFFLERVSPSVFNKSTNAFISRKETVKRFSTEHQEWCEEYINSGKCVKSVLNVMFYEETPPSSL